MTGGPGDEQGDWQASVSRPHSAGHASAPTARPFPIQGAPVADGLQPPARTASLGGHSVSRMDPPPGLPTAQPKCTLFAPLPSRVSCTVWSLPGAPRVGGGNGVKTGVCTARSLLTFTIHSVRAWSRRSEDHSGSWGPSCSFPSARALNRLPPAPPDHLSPSPLAGAPAVFILTLPVTCPPPLPQRVGLPEDRDPPCVPRPSLCTQGGHIYSSSSPTPPGVRVPWGAPSTPDGHVSPPPF